MPLSASAGRFFSIMMIASAVGGAASCAETAPDADPVSAAQSSALAPPPDCLYVADDNRVPALDEIERFDALTGARFDPIVSSGEVPLDTIKELIFDRSRGPNADLIVVDQNSATEVTNPELSGEIVRYALDGTFEGVVVHSTPDSTDPNVAWEPVGAVLRDHTLYVADMGDNDPLLPGRIVKFDARTGKWLGDIGHDVFTTTDLVRGIVFGPDGNLYVSVRDRVTAAVSVRRFDARTGESLGVFVDSARCACGFVNPVALVFGPDGNLYVISGRIDVTSVDQIFVFDGKTGRLLRKIPLDTPGGDRAIALSMAFGPRGLLYVPITLVVGGVGAVFTGEVRAYDVTTDTPRVVVPRDTGLKRPSAITFCGTNPATRAYEPSAEGCSCEP